MCKGSESRCSPASPLHQNQEPISALSGTDLKKKNLKKKSHGGKKKKINIFATETFLTSIPERAPAIKKAARTRRSHQSNKFTFQSFLRTVKMSLPSLMGKLQCHRKVAICCFVLKRIHLKWPFNPGKGARTYRRIYIYILSSSPESSAQSCLKTVESVCSILPLYLPLPELLSDIRDELVNFLKPLPDSM